MNKTLCITMMDFDFAKMIKDIFGETEFKFVGQTVLDPDTGKYLDTSVVYEKLIERLNVTPTDGCVDSVHNIDRIISIHQDSCVIWIAYYEKNESKTNYIERISSYDDFEIIKIGNFLYAISEDGIHIVKEVFRIENTPDVNYEGLDSTELMDKCRCDHDYSGELDDCSAYCFWVIEELDSDETFFDYFYRFTNNLIELVKSDVANKKH